MKKKAQATLEFTVVFVIMVFLLMGMISLWKWSSDNMVKRQIDYNASRKEAGTRSSDSTVSPQLKVIE
ncbi:MAG: pilus assembly protein [Candidatus Omnitrophica bacterium]|jgi:uncharacterized protein (UPF0333 family)|nr:pilus assembly protein [Candidatus Omnitrophota bacterium]